MNPEKQEKIKPKYTSKQTKNRRKIKNQSRNK